MVDTRGEYHDLQAIYLPIAAAVFVVVVGVLLFIALRWRRRDDRTPRQRTEAHLLEGVYVLALAGLAAFLVGTTYHTESKVDPVAKRAGLDVRVTAAKWRWRFDYPSLGFSEIGTNTIPPTLRVPTGTTVRFTMESLDVIHSFWIPALRFKRDAFPRRVTRFDLVFERPMFKTGGGVCAEYCGLRHGDMRFGVEAMRPAEFQAWANRRRAGGRSR